MHDRDQSHQPPRRAHRGRRRSTRRLVTCALLCSLAVVILGMGMLVEIFDLTAAACAAMVLLPILLCYGSRYALMSYAVTAVLGVILMPQSLGAWMFAGVTGYYPLVKQKLDGLPKVLGWITKMLIPLVVMLGYLAVFFFVMLGVEGSFMDAFLVGFGEGEGSALLAWAVVGLSLFTYVLFDLLIDRLLVLYYIRWQKRVEKWMGK